MQLALGDFYFYYSKQVNEASDNLIQLYHLPFCV